MEVDSNVLDLIDGTQDKGFTIIPKLIGDKPLENLENYSITKITSEDITSEQHE